LYTLTINWLDEGRAFVLHVRSGEVTFWKIHETTKKMVKVRTMRLSVDESFSYLYAGSKHLVTSGASNDDSIYVFDRNGKLVHTLLEDISKPHESHAWSPMNACIVKGCLLVTNSLLGAALCVWNIPTGRLLQRFEQSIEQGHCFRPGNNYSDGTWVHCLDQLPSFDFPFFLLADNDGSLFSWGFPADESQMKRMKCLEHQAMRES
jgi:WD40 repeat protein